MVFTRLLTSASAGARFRRAMIAEEIAFKTCYYLLKRHPPALRELLSWPSGLLRARFTRPRVLGGNALPTQADIDAAFIRAAKWMDETNLAQEARLCV
jgi:hypothetical protein